MNADRQPATDLAATRRAQRRALRIALAANAALLIAEVAGGVVFGSLVLLADAAHLFSDVAGLAVAVLAMRLIERPATLRHSFGLQRAEVLAAQANAVLLLVASLWVFYEGIRRLVDPVAVDGVGLVALAATGLVVNVGAAIVVARVRGSSLNMRGALLHLGADAAASVGALLAGVLIAVWKVERADPAIAILIGLAVLYTAWRLLRETTHVLLEGTPHGMDPVAVERFLAGQQDVVGVHHLHLWNLASDVPALSAHVVLAEGATMHDAQLRGERLKERLAERFGIEHATLELECHDCEPAPDEVTRSAPGVPPLGTVGEPAPREDSPPSRELRR